MGRVIAAYRTHPYHGRPLSQELVGGWVGLTQAQLSRIENGPPVKDLDKLRLWARVLRIPAELLWFKVPDEGAGGEDQGLALSPEPRSDQLLTRPRTLPPALPDFTGRTAEREALAAALRRSEAPRWVLISGQAGLGKTALAVQVAHDVADSFPDGQLFVRLRRPDGSAVAPEVALARLLGLLGYRGAAVPQELEERSGLFRSAVVGRRVLLVLDDCVDETQVRWLLPGSPSCAVFLTSRSRLAGIEGVARPGLGPLTDAEARTVMTQVVGEDRIAKESDAAAELLRLSAGLPLALRIIAAGLAARPEWSLEHMTGLLADERRRLDWLKVGDLEVRASLMLSYQHLSADQQRLFRLLGILDAPDFPGWIASALTADTTPSVEHNLDRLIDIHLVEALPGGGGEPRYRMHPLVRLLAAELANAHEAAEGRHAAIARVADGYLLAADAAANGLPRRFVFDDLPPDLWTPPDAIMTLARDNPRSWFAGEQTAIATTIRQSTKFDLIRHAWLLFQRLGSHLDLRHDLATIEGLAEYLLPEVRSAGDQRGEAATIRLRCQPMGFRDQMREIPDLARRAVQLRERLGDTSGEIEARRVLGAALTRIGALDAGRRELDTALALAEVVGDGTHLGFGFAISGMVQAVESVEDINRVLLLLGQATARGVENGENLGRLRLDEGALLAVCGRFAEAEAKLLDARVEFDRSGEDWRAATVDLHLARICVDTGRTEKGARLLEAASRIITEHQDAYGESVVLSIRARLAQARGRGRDARALARQAADSWNSLPYRPSSMIDQWRGSPGLVGGD